MQGLWFAGIRRVELHRIIRWLSSRDGCQGTDPRSNIIITPDHPIWVTECLLFILFPQNGQAPPAELVLLQDQLRDVSLFTILYSFFFLACCCFSAQGPQFHFQHTPMVLAFERDYKWNTLPTEPILLEPWYWAHGQVSDWSSSTCICTRLWRRTSSGWHTTSRERPTSSRWSAGWWTWSSRPSNRRARRMKPPMVRARKGRCNSPASCWKQFLLFSFSVVLGSHLLQPGPVHLCVWVLWIDFIHVTQQQPPVHQIRTLRWGATTSCCCWGPRKTWKARKIKSAKPSRSYSCRGNRWKLSGSDASSLQLQHRLISSTKCWRN